MTTPVEAQLRETNARIVELERDLSAIKAWQNRMIAGGVDSLFSNKGAGSSGTGSVVRWLDLELTNLTVENTTDETSLYEVVIPAGQFSPPRVVIVEFVGRVKNDSGGNQAIAISVHLNSTEMWADDITLSDDPQNGIFYLRAILATNATNDQELGGVIVIGPRANADTGSGSLSGTTTAATGIGGLATENSSLDMTLSVKADFSAADLALEVVRRMAFTVII